MPGAAAKGALQLIGDSRRLDSGRGGGDHGFSNLLSRF
jgi:hypothetical protein